MKIRNYFTCLGVATAIALSTVSCEKEIDNIGVDLIDNDMFENQKITSNIQTESQNTESVKATGVGQYLFGIYKDSEFGSLKGSIISQLSISSTGDNYTYGDNMTIDEVILDLPYQATRNTEDYDDGKPKYAIDSVFGVPTQEFKINVYELGTYLNILDPSDPSKNATYLSDKEYIKSTKLYAENFKVNQNDTVAYIKRRMLDGTIYDTDTIKTTGATPSIKLRLDKALIKNIFVDNINGIDFSSLETFKKGFRGLYIEPESLNANQTHLISLLVNTANMKIYFSNDVVKDEGEDEDLNGNDVKGEEGVTVRTKNVFTFSLNGIKINKLERDYTTSKASGDDRIYIQGAAGSDAVIELFIDEDIQALRDQNLLITEANLVLYIDQEADTKLIPEQLFIYDYSKNEHIRDIFTEGIAVVGGVLLTDDEGNSLHKYKFSITDYIADILTSDEDFEGLKLGIKVYNGTSEMPSSITDIAIKNLSWTPKGVVIFNESEAHGDKRLKLDISYSKLNEQ
ncbi:MAG: hypothetical protein COB81_09610 [Flavobacteriaceae bacterium]|nr:MAG: hypothetical protein COB81_09610 [Flavobacteriaceae bacterium]